MTNEQRIQTELHLYGTTTDKIDKLVADRCRDLYDRLRMVDNMLSTADDHAAMGKPEEARFSRNAARYVLGEAMQEVR